MIDDLVIFYTTMSFSFIIDLLVSTTVSFSFIFDLLVSTITMSEILKTFEKVNFKLQICLKLVFLVELMFISPPPDSLKVYLNNQIKANFSEVQFKVH